MVLDFRGDPHKTDFTDDGDNSDDDVLQSLDDAINIRFDDLTDHDQFDDIVDADDSDDDDYSPDDWTDEDFDIDEAGPPVNVRVLIPPENGDSDGEVEVESEEEEEYEELDGEFDEESQSPNEPDVDTNGTT